MAPARACGRVYFRNQPTRRSTSLSFVNVLITARALGVEGARSLAFLMTFLRDPLVTAHIVWCRGGEREYRRHVARTSSGARTNAVLLSIVFGAAAIVVLATLIAFVPAVGGGTSPELLLVALGSISVLTLQFYSPFSSFALIMALLWRTVFRSLDPC